MGQVAFKRKPPPPGPGRPKGSISKRTKFIRAVSDKAIKEGVVPLEVMLDNMRFYHNKAEDLLLEILEAQKHKKLSEKHILALAKCYEYRERAGKSAADAAPYVHPRLSAIAVKSEVTKRFELPEGLSLEKAMELYRDSLHGRPPSQMKLVEDQVIKDQGDEAEADAS